MQRLARFLLAMVLVVSVTAAGCRSTSGTGGGTAAPGPGAASRPATVHGVPTSAGTHKLDLDVGGFGHREYLLHVPAGLTGGTWRNGRPAHPVPLVLALHGGLSTMGGMETLSGFDRLSDQKGFLVAYPDGFLTTWNAGDCCGAAKLAGTDDVGFLAKLIGALVGTGMVDPARVYATGFSNGAGMAYRLACERSGLLAGIGVVEGALVTRCAPDHHVSVMIFHGTADPAVPYGGGGTRDINDHRPFPPVSFAVDFWRRADGLGGLSANAAAAKALTTDARTRCQGTTGGAAAVAFCRIDGGGHQWRPGTAALLWEFFANHARA